MPDIQLESTRGRRVSLADLRGRVCVLFYEAKGHTEDNEALKQACGRLVDGGRLGPRLEVLGVADLRGYGFGPVQAVVRRAVRASAERYGTELYYDFDGALQGAPLHLAGGDSNVAILDAGGALVFRARGALDAAEVDRFFAALSDALSRAGAPRVSLPSAA